MAAGAGVFARVLIRRAVATECRVTGLAGAKMDPGGADLHALLALKTPGPFDRGDRVDVLAGWVCHPSL